MLTAVSFMVHTKVKPCFLCLGRNTASSFLTAFDHVWLSEVVVKSVSH